MGMFDDSGYAEGMPLSDEAIYGAEVDTEETATEADEIEEEERHGEEPQPRDGQSDTSTEEEPAVEDRPAEEQIHEADSGEQTTEDVATITKRYNDLRSWTSRVSNENSNLRKELEALKALQAVPAAPAAPQKTAQQQAEPKGDGKEFLREILSKGPAALDAYIDGRAREMVRPILEERERAAFNQRFGAALTEVSEGWPQVKDAEGRGQAMRKIVDLATKNGNPDGWRSEPEAYLMMACKSLWGFPLVADQGAVTAAAKAEREAVLAEIAEKQNKAGKVVQTSANKTQNKTKELSPEEQIIADMFKYSGSGMFG